MEAENDEKDYLLASNKQNDDTTNFDVNDKNVTDSITDERTLLNSKQAFYIMVGSTIGSGVLIMPNNVRQLGVIYWLVVFVVVLFIQFISTYVLNKSVTYVMEQSDDFTELIREPYQALAEKCGGIRLRRLSVFFMYFGNIFFSLSEFLLAANILATFVPLGNFSLATHTRIWMTIIIVIVTPIVFLGTYSNLKVPAIAATFSSILSGLCIIINSFMKMYLYDKNHNTKAIELLEETTLTQDGFFLTAGAIMFTTLGSSIVIPNITILSSAPKQLQSTIISSFCVIGFCYTINGLIPYYMFNGVVSPSILTTFQYIIQYNGDVYAFSSLTLIVELLMFIHLLMAGILVLNPVFLHMEEQLSISLELNWKRVAVRSWIMFILLIISLIFPNFNTIISLAGGVPCAIQGILLPLFIYTQLFELNIYKKVAFYMLIGLVSVMVVGNFVSSVAKLVMG